MDFISPVCGKRAGAKPDLMNHRVPQAVVAVLLVLAAAVGSDAAAEFNVRRVQPQLGARALDLSARLKLNLSRKAERALDRGIPLSVVIDVDLLRHRHILWDKSITSWILHRSLRFHALSREYLVSGVGADNYGNFSSLRNALDYLGEIDALRLPLRVRKPLSAGGDYRVQLRVYLDIGALPSPLQPVAYASPGWHLNSGWTTWSVER